jgi:hypothetical protein
MNLETEVQRVKTRCPLWAARFLLIKIERLRHFLAAGAFSLERKMLQMLICGMLMLVAMAQVKAEEQRAVRSFELTINGPVDKVFPLFTPQGENLWIPTWKFTPIYPASGDTVRDMVFRTDEDTLWTLAVYEPPRRSVYVHTTNDLLARIEVVCEPLDANHTRMKITWVFTAITEQGQVAVEHHNSEADLPKKQANWKKWLDEYAVKAGWTK